MVLRLHEIILYIYIHKESSDLLEHMANSIELCYLCVVPPKLCGKLYLVNIDFMSVKSMPEQSGAYRGAPIEKAMYCMPFFYRGHINTSHAPGKQIM